MHQIVCTVGLYIQFLVKNVTTNKATKRSLAGSPYTIYVNFEIVLKKTLIHLIEAEVDFDPQIKIYIKVFSFILAKMLTRCDHFCTFAGNMPLHDTQLRQISLR